MIMFCQNFNAKIFTNCKILQVVFQYITMHKV